MALPSKVVSGDVQTYSFEPTTTGVDWDQKLQGTLIKTLTQDYYTDFIADIKAGTVETWNGMLTMCYIPGEGSEAEAAMQTVSLAAEYSMAPSGETEGTFFDFSAEDSAATIGATMTAVAALTAILM